MINQKGMQLERTNLEDKDREKRDMLMYLYTCDATMKGSFITKIK